MNTISRVLLTAVLCTAAVACSKKVKELPPADTGPSTGVVDQTGPTTPGAYGPGDLDTEACLRQRVVYFDLDQDALRPEGSEASRAGKECVRTCRPRGAPSHPTKKQ